jgi:DNA replication protein DnaC
MTYKQRQLSDPNRVEFCEVCLKPMILEPVEIANTTWYRKTWEGHADCYADLMTRQDRVREQQIEEERRQKAEAKVRMVAEAIACGFENSGISPERRTFADLKRYNSNGKAYDASVAWKFPDLGFFLYGPPGTGKSHALAAIAQTIPEKYDVRFSMIRWGRWVKETYAQNDFSSREMMARWIREAPVLFIDDMGAEKLSEHSESLLDDIMHEREEFKRPTFMSSNLTPEGLEKLLTPRLWSRMQSLMEFIQVGGKDIRKAKGTKK